MVLTLGGAGACGAPSAPRAEAQAPREGATSPPKQIMAPTVEARAPVPESVSPKADLSKQLGGMRLGMSVDELTSACRGGQGTMTRVSEIELSCSVAPEPLRSPSTRARLNGSVAGVFCGPGATLCEVTYVLDGEALKSDEQTSALVDLLVGKYGPPTNTDGYAASDALAQCRRAKSAHFKRQWLFDLHQSPPHPLGAARLTFACDLRVSAEARSVTLSYADEYGMRYRARGEQATPRDNF